MSVERVKRKSGVVWRVRWREGNRNRARTVSTKRDALTLDAEIRRRVRIGELVDFDAGRETLAEFAEEWWKLYALANLGERTQRSYAWFFDKHILPRLGGHRLQEIHPEVVERFRADLRAGGVGL